MKWLGKVFIVYRDTRYLAKYAYDSNGQIYYELPSGQIIRDKSEVKEAR